MQRRLIEYIRRPDSLDAQAISQLHAIVEKHPYYHSARILLLEALYKRHSPDFNKELRRSAPLIPDRHAIFTLIEKKNFLADEERRKYDRDSWAIEDTTESIIDKFLETQPQEHPNSLLPVTAATDYIGYLLQNEEEESKKMSAVNSDNDNTNDIINDFLNQSEIRIDVKAEKPEGPPTLTSDEPTQNEVMTETLAHIYIKQGKFEKAIEIIRRLSLKYPKKNRYFADQIRFLEKLIINNKNNKQ